MATPQSAVHGILRPREVFAALALMALVFLHLWELPRLAAEHGGAAFVLAWALCSVLFGLPLVLTQLLLGRRSRRSPLEGMAYLTREADVPRFWRLPAWGSALLSLLALAAVALVAGGSLNFLAHDLRLVSDVLMAASQGGIVLPMGSATLLLLAAGLSLLSPARRALVLTIGLLLILLLLLLAALAGAGTAAALYAPGPLTAQAWRAAMGLALCGTAAGAGVIWIAGMQTPRDGSLAPLGLAALFAHLLFGFLLLLALAPFVAAMKANVGDAGLQIVPMGPAVWMLMPALVLAAVLALQLLAEPLLYWLAEKKMLRLQAVLLVFVLAGLLMEVVWYGGGPAGLQLLLKALGLVLLLAALGFTLFAGWAMKVSHARKELALPNEGLYNLWRVAVRIALPLAILWVLVGFFL
ncbi:MAG: hypothetical protein ACRERR_13685 [Moraxellaceae bacterium]